MIKVYPGAKAAFLSPPVQFGNEADRTAPLAQVQRADAFWAINLVPTQ